MKKTLSFILISVMILGFSSCGIKKPADSQVNDGTTLDQSNHSQATNGSSKTLPTSYPKDILPLARDAVILDVRENPANKGLEVTYVSGNDINTLCDYYEGALKEAKDLTTVETKDGYMVTAKMDGVWYTIMLSKDAMKSNPQYADKISVYIVLTGLVGVSGNESQMPKDGEPWPATELPGVPELEGVISKIMREEHIIRLEITVKNAEKVRKYIGELTSAGFSFDTQPDMDSDHMEFLAYKGSSMMSFAYKGIENLVTIEYQQ